MKKDNKLIIVDITMSKVTNKLYEQKLANIGKKLANIQPT